MGELRIGRVLLPSILAVLAFGLWQAAGTASSAFETATTALNGGCRSDGILADFGAKRLLFGGDRTEASPISVSCPGDYEVVLVSGDRFHRPGYQAAQTEERWLVELLGSGGEILGQIGPTDDLPIDQTIGITIRSVVLSGDEVAVRARHVGPAGAVHSVTPLAVALLPRSTELTCGDPFTTVEFDGPALRAGEEESVEIAASYHCLCGAQHVVAVGQDLGHQPGYQQGQTEERWLLETADSDGSVLGSTEPTADLADDRWARVDLLSMEVDVIDGDMTITARNTATTGPNSIDPVVAVIVAK